MTRARHRVCSSLLAGGVLGLILILFAAPSARAESWGELKGESTSLETGSAQGQVNVSGWNRFAASSDGSFYTLNEAEGKLVLSRHEKAGGKADAVVAIAESEKEVEGGLEGVNAALAVSGDRIYVLSIYERRERSTKEEAEEEKDGKPVFPADMEMQAAGTLYEFEYSTTKKTLVKKSSKLTHEALHAQGEGPREALLDPRGMAVDPANGDLAISGLIDEESNANVRQGKEKQCRPAVQFVKVGKEGELALGARYVDQAAVTQYGHEGCGGEEEEEAMKQALISPAFAPDGTLLGYNESEQFGPGESSIWQFAPAKADESSESEVTAFTPRQLFLPEEIPTFAFESEEEEPAPVLSVVPENATEATVYLSGYQFGLNEPAPLVLHYTTAGGGALSEVGWTAGGKENEHLGAGECDLHKSTFEPIQLTGITLPGGKRGMLALTFYDEFEGEPPKSTPRAELLEFGEGGSTKGCPTVPVTKPVQSFNGAPTGEIPAGTPVEISSVLGTVEPDGGIKAAAGAKSVVWKAEYTPPAGSSEPKQEETLGEVKYEEDDRTHPEDPDYAFKLKLDTTLEKPGTYEITDYVRTDDLADQEAKPAEPDKLVVSGGKLRLSPKPASPAEARAHETNVQLNVEADLPGESKLTVKKVTWGFGDGTAEVVETPGALSDPAVLSTKHVFSRCATLACKGKVTVEVENGKHELLTESAGFEERVLPSKSEEEAENQPPPTTTSTGSTPPPPPPPPPPPTGKGEVAGYIATLAGGTLKVASSGAAVAQVSCPAGGACHGTLTLETTGPVALKPHQKKVLVLATESFSLSAGVKSVTLHLTSAGRTLLARAHGTLRAKVIVLSRATAAGQTNSTASRIVTLHLVEPRKKK